MRVSHFLRRSNRKSSGAPQIRAFGQRAADAAAPGRRERGVKKIRQSAAARLRVSALAGALLAAALLGIDSGAGPTRVNFAAAQEVATPSPDPQQPDAETEAGTPSPAATRSVKELLESIPATATARAQVTLTAAAVATDIALTPTATPTPLPTSTPTPTPTSTSTPTPSSTPTPGPDEILDARIDNLIAEMTVADRVGQLFVVTFQGSHVGPRSDIAELIEEYRVGGVVISPRNRNFSNDSGTTREDVARLTNQLQALAYGIYLAPSEALNLKEGAPAIPGILPSALEQRLPLELPLLIGVEQGGDGLPMAPLRAGFTAIPPQMALGATWNPALVEELGAVRGRELGSVGVNLLLGPALDVMEQPRPDLVTGFGLHTFGGDPFWVGRMGQAYVTGIHRGSDGRVATVAGHFPGLGGTDRRPDEEIATIQKSLQELQRIELPPFAAVTGRPSAILRGDGSMAATEALMSGHIRFSSFQGSRERTPPISLAQELGIILDLNEFAPWREQGGILMSDALGVMAVRRYYDPSLQEFPRRRIALDAFTAGNDLLYLANFFSLTDSWLDARANIKETIIFFRERYTNDAEFAARVDASLRRILRLKFRLYDPLNTADRPETAPPSLDEPLTIDLADVVVGPGDLEDGFRPGEQKEAQMLLDQVASEALTIFFPESAGLTDPLPAPPGEDERILIFTDSRILHECEGCRAAPAVEPTALEEIMLRLYGPEATNQLRPEQIRSRTFVELNSLLNGTADDALANALDEEIGNAAWLIFAMLDVDVANYESSDAVKQFLRLRSDRLPGSKLVVLALNEPYFFDSTEIGKMTAYLGVYSKTQPFLEASVRALFRAQTVSGAPPVNVPGTRFSNLVERLEPDPNQRISLTLLNENIVTEEAEGSEVVVSQADLSIGDSLELEAGPVLDRNGNMVPDGTPVNFRLIYEGEELALPSNPVATRGGLARKSVLLERPGTLLIAVSSVEATSSTGIRARIPDPAVAEAGTRTQISVIDPDPTAAPTAAQAPLPTAGPTPETGPTTIPPVVPSEIEVDIASWAIAIVTQLVVLALLLVVLVQVMPRQLLVHRLLWAMLVGWGAYILYGLGVIPGGVWIQLNLSPWDSVPVVVIGMLIPLVWLQFRTE